MVIKYFSQLPVTKKKQPDWTSLPKDILDTIAEFLDRQSDIDRFRVVCKKFQSSAPPRRELPPAHSSYKIPFPESSNDGDVSHLLLTQSTIFAIQPRNDEIPNISQEGAAKTWLIKIEKTESGNVQLKDPLTQFSFRRLSRNLPETLNLLDYDVEEITKAYGLEVVANPKYEEEAREEEEEKEDDDDDYNIDFDPVEGFYFQKVVVSGCFTEEDERFTIMAIYGINETRKLALWRKMNGNWTEIVYDPDFFHADDIVYCDRKYYVVGIFGDAITMDCESLVIIKVADPQPKPRDGFRSLVKSSNHMFMVAKYWLDDDIHPNEDNEDSEDESNSIGFCVFKLDEERHAWIEIEDELEETSLFIGKDCSFSISSKRFKGCGENCIFFPDAKFIGMNECYPGWFAGIYDLEDDTVGPVSAFPNFSKIFWPPSTWLKQSSSSPPSELTIPKKLFVSRAGDFNSIILKKFTVMVILVVSLILLVIYSRHVQ